MIHGEKERIKEVHDPKTREPSNIAASLSASLPMVHIIILNWNQWQLTAECLNSLKKLNYSNFKILLVDNGSTDDSCLELQNRFPEQEILKSNKNLGFGGGCNLGMQKALKEGADFIWLLNNDATADTNALKAMVNLAREKPGLGAIGSQVLDAKQPHAVQAWGGGRISLIWGRSWHIKDRTADTKLDYLIGASLLLKAEALRKVGLFDPGFFLYWEDADLCQRLKKAGWGLAVAEDSRIFHRGNASMQGQGRKWALFFTQSSRRFFIAHAPWPFLPIFCGSILRMVSAIMKGRWPDFLGIVQVYCNYKKCSTQKTLH
ncbi:glycosyltransferase family 2 protein [Dethiosulfatarculus sandiegensis]|uniref:Glycosyl transferase family 2 n=1 Tax=Dethiosulfatarculus sandiegensis TaxID=1429043 RepID=A0A0D2JHR3_9BACT|nr:glycosyltransferase family 2 protein [Dethiosulfatarculus sandiegensis]KIX15296.1 glycosyl transferase family 2 [Dethiosulfatarculus sandiegensis]